MGKNEYLYIEYEKPVLRWKQAKLNFDGVDLIWLCWLKRRTRIKASLYPWLTRCRQVLSGYQGRIPRTKPEILNWYVCFYRQYQTSIWFPKLYTFRDKLKIYGPEEYRRWRNQFTTVLCGMNRHVCKITSHFITHSSAFLKISKCLTFNNS